MLYFLFVGRYRQTRKPDLREHNVPEGGSSLSRIGISSPSQRPPSGAEAPLGRSLSRWPILDKNIRFLCDLRVSSESRLWRDERVVNAVKLSNQKKKEELWKRDWLMQWDHNREGDREDLKYGVFSLSS
jgi:hypothetical protein